MRLDRFIAARVTRLSRTRAARLKVKDLNQPQRRLKKASRICAGQQLWVQRPLPEEAQIYSKPELIFKDDELLVLNKGPDLAVHPTASRFRATVTHFLAQVWPSAGPAHRIDVETSGLLLCGRSPEVTQVLTRAFLEQRVQKRYLAVVEGQPPERWESQQALGFDKRSAVHLKYGPGTLPAHTRFQVLRRGPQRALLEAQPLSGRQHQIRVHLSLAGFPIVGDKLYGPDEALFLANLERPLLAQELQRLGCSRQALHAWRLSFDWKGIEQRFEAPWPQDLEALLHVSAGCVAESRATDAGRTDPH